MTLQYNSPRPRLPALTLSLPTATAPAQLRLHQQPALLCHQLLTAPNLSTPLPTVPFPSPMTTHSLSTPPIYLSTPTIYLSTPLICLSNPPICLSTYPLTASVALRSAPSAAAAPTSVQRPLVLLASQPASSTAPPSLVNLRTTPDRPTTSRLLLLLLVNQALLLRTPPPSLKSTPQPIPSPTPSLFLPSRALWPTYQSASLLMADPPATSSLSPSCPSTTCQPVQVLRLLFISPTAAPTSAPDLYPRPTSNSALTAPRSLFWQYLSPPTTSSSASPGSRLSTPPLTGRPTPSPLNTTSVSSHYGLRLQKKLHRWNL